MPPLAREVEGDAGDALDLVRRIDLGIDGALLAILERDDLLGLAEINPARQLAHDHDVEAFDQLALQRGGIGQRRIADGGAQVGEEPEVLPEPQQPGLGAHRIGHLVPLGAADGAEDHGVGLLRFLHHGVGDGNAVLVVGRPADEIAFGLEPAALGALVEERDDALDLGDGFDADPVSGQQQQVKSGHSRCLVDVRWNSADERQAVEQHEAVQHRNETAGRQHGAQHEQDRPAGDDRH